MKRRLLILAALVVASGARAQQISGPMVPNFGIPSPLPTAMGGNGNVTGPGAAPYVASGNGATAASASAARSGQTINVKADFGARGDVLSYGDGTIVAGTRAFSSASATFTAADVGKTIIVDYAGTSGAPLVTTISTFVDAHHITLAANAATSTPYAFVWSYPITASQSGAGSYAPGDTITLSGGTATAVATANVIATQVASLTINAAGSGATLGNGLNSGSCQIIGSTGSGPAKFIANVTITGGALSAIGGFTQQGLYSVNPSSLSAEPVVFYGGCSGLTGATVMLSMGAAIVQPTNPGSYSSAPTSPASTTTSGSGTGLTVSPQWITAGAFAYGTDDTAALTSAWNAEIAANANSPGFCIEAPAGAYLVSAPLPNFYRTPGCVRGAGRTKTVFLMSPALSGDLMSWSESWLASTFSSSGSLAAITGQASGPVLRDFTILGDRTAPNTQNAVMFYDRDDEIDMRGVSIKQVNGTCLGAGATKNTTQAYVRESDFEDIKAWYCGNATHPAIVFDSQGSAGADATNEVKFDHIDVFAYFGPGFVLRNNNSSNATRLIEIGKLRVEGIQFDPVTIAADAMVIGDSSETGSVNSATCAQCELIDPYFGQYALRIDAAAPNYAPYAIDFKGMIGGGLPFGGGLDINYGRANQFYLSAINSVAPNVTMSTNAGGQNVIWGPGRSEQSWSYNLAGSAAPVSFPIMVGNPQAGTAYVTTAVGDTTAWGGSTPGQGSVNFLPNRTTTYSTSAGYSSTLVGGLNGVAAGNFSAVVGGNGNGMTGQYSGAIAGAYATDRGWYGGRCHASGSLTDYSGDANFCEVVLRCQAAATNASTCTATSNNGAAAGTNNLGIPNNAAYAVQLDCVAISRATPGNNEAWPTWTGLLTRGTGAATTAWNSAGPGEARRQHRPRTQCRRSPRPLRHQG